MTVIQPMSLYENRECRNVATLDELFSVASPGRCAAPSLLSRLQGENSHGETIAATLRPGLHLVLCDVDFDTDNTWCFGGGKEFKVQVRLSGDSHLKFDDNAEFSVTSEHVALLSHPHGVMKTQKWIGGTREKSITVLIEPNQLPSLFKEASGSFRGCLPSVGSKSQYALQFCPTSPLVRHTAQMLWDACFAAEQSRLLVEAKTLELLYHVSQLQLCSGDEAGNSLSGRDRMRIERAWDIVTHNYTDFNLSIPKIASMAGINQTKLCKGFKDLYGVSVFDYSQQLRMEKAQAMLIESELPIIEIALSIGYEHPCNFATAYKRFFGCTPRQARIQR